MISTRTTNTKGILSGPIPLRLRAAPRIMMAPSATGIARARSHGAHVGVPDLVNAAAYPTAIVAIDMNRATSAARLVASVAAEISDVFESVTVVCAQIRASRANVASQCSPM